MPPLGRLTLTEINFSRICNFQKSVFNRCQNMTRVWDSLTAACFMEKATANARSAYLSLCRELTSLSSDVNRRPGLRDACIDATACSIGYDGAGPFSALNASAAILNSTRWAAGSQCSSSRTLSVIAKHKWPDTLAGEALKALSTLQDSSHDRTGVYMRHFKTSDWCDWCQNKTKLSFVVLPLALPDKLIPQSKG